MPPCDGDLWAARAAAEGSGTPQIAPAQPLWKDTVGTDARTPLMEAAIQGNAEIVTQLLEAAHYEEPKWAECTAACPKMVEERRR